MSYKLGDKVIVVGAGSPSIPKGSILDVVSKCSVNGQWISPTDVQLNYLGSEGKGGMFALAPFTSVGNLENTVSRLKDIKAEIAKLTLEEQQLHCVLRNAGLALIA